MSITIERKAELIKTHGRTEGDTGSAEVQVAIACRKAGIDPADHPELERFEVLTFQEVPDEP